MSNKAPVVIEKTWTLVLGRLLKKHGKQNVELKKFCDQQGVRIDTSALSRIINKDLWKIKDATVKPFISAVEQFVTQELGEDCECIWEQDQKDGITFTELRDVTGTRRNTNKPNHNWKEPEPAMLSQEAMQRFNLFEDPFGLDVPDIDDMFQTDSTRQTLEVMRRTAKNCGMLAVTGEVGAGKSCIYQQFKAHVLPKMPTVKLIEPAMFNRALITPESLQITLLRALNTKVPNNHEDRCAKISEVMINKVDSESTRFLLLIEEAHQLTDEVLKYLKTLREIGSVSKKTMGIILIAQPELHKKFSYDTRQFAGRCTKWQIPPLGKDTEAYIHHKLKVAGAQPIELLADCAMQAVLSRLTDEDRRRKKTTDMTYAINVGNLVNAAINKAAQLCEDKVTAEVVNMAEVL